MVGEWAGGDVKSAPFERLLLLVCGEAGGREGWGGRAGATGRAVLVARGLLAAPGRRRPAVVVGARLGSTAGGEAAGVGAPGCACAPGAMGQYPSRLTPLSGRFRVHRAHPVVRASPPLNALTRAPDPDGDAPATGPRLDGVWASGPSRDAPCRSIGRSPPRRPAPPGLHGGSRAGSLADRLGADGGRICGGRGDRGGGRGVRYRRPPAGRRVYPREARFLDGTSRPRSTR